MARGVPAPDNARAGKALFLYDGHNRRPGVSAANDTRRWREMRRRVRLQLRHLDQVHR